MRQARTVNSHKNICVHRLVQLHKKWQAPKKSEFQLDNSQHGGLRNLRIVHSDYFEFDQRLETADKL